MSGGDSRISYSAGAIVAGASETRFGVIDAHSRESGDYRHAENVGGQTVWLTDAGLAQYRGALAANAADVESGLSVASQFRVERDPAGFWGSLINGDFAGALSAATRCSENKTTIGKT